MSLSKDERREIEEIIEIALQRTLRPLQQDIVRGFVECIDWYTENMAKILETQNAEAAKMFAKWREQPEHKHAGFK